MKFRTLITAVVALGLASATYVYRAPLLEAAGARAPAAAAEKHRHRGDRPVAVHVATVERRAAPQQLTAIGTAQAVATVAVKARVDGQITAALFSEGSRVTSGQVLFRLDQRPFEVALQQAQANAARDKAQLDKTLADLKRYADLAKKGYAPRQQYEQAKADYAALQATLRADAASVEAARLQLGYTEIRAPIDGRTGSLLVSAGNLVKANDSNPLVVITRLDPVYVAFSVPEQHLNHIRALMAAGPVPVTAWIGDTDSHPLHGRLTFINTAVDSGTGTVQLKATFANDDGFLTPGAFVHVAMVVDPRPDAIVVPTPAVQTGQDGKFVFVVKPDNTVEPRAVRVADSNKDIAVIASGLTPGERVVTDGQLQLYPGAKVRQRGAGDAEGRGPQQEAKRAVASERGDRPAGTGPAGDGPPGNAQPGNGT